MKIEEQIMLLILGASIALLSSIVTIMVQNINQQRLQSEQDKKTKQLTAYYSSIITSIEKKIEDDDPILFVGEELRKMAEELEKRDISDIPSDKLLDLFLQYSQHRMNFIDWMYSGALKEAEQVNTLGSELYKKLRGRKK